MISPSHSGAPHGRLHSQNEHSDPRIHLNIKRMLTVISDASSIEMYDRHAVILDYLAKSLVRDHNSPSDSDIPLLFDLNGKDETSNFCRIMVEAHQRALEGGGLQLTCPLINLITLICQTIGKRESFETKEYESIVKILDSFTSIITVGPCDGSEEQYAWHFSIVQCILQSVLAWTQSSEDISIAKQARKVDLKDLVAPKLINVYETQKEKERTVTAYPIHLKLLESSTIVADCIKQLDSIQKENEETVVLVLQLVYHLRMSPKIMSAVGRAQGATRIIKIFKSCYTENESAFKQILRSLALEILWCLYNSPSSCYSRRELSSAECFDHINIIFKAMSNVNYCRRQLDKEIRNDFVLLLSRIIENSFGILNDDKEDSDVKKAVEKTLEESDLPYILVDCLKNDPSLCDTLTDRQKIEINHVEDYIFVRILLQLASQLSKSKCILEKMLNRGILRICFVNFETEPAKKHHRWNQHQILAVRQEVIGLLTAVLHQAPLAYAETEGPLSLCKFLQHSLTHNESVPGNAVADSERFSLTESVLKFLLFVVERMVDQREPFVQSGLMTFCLDILRVPGYSIEVFSTVFLVCSALCRNNRSAKRLFGSIEGVEMVVLYLNHNSPDRAETEKIRLVTIEAIWTCIVGNSNNEALFMQLGGLYKMLDILSEESSKKVHRHLLGAFLDLLENPKARSHALEWKYVDAHEEEKKSLVNLLIKLWREEEKALGFVDDGFIEIDVFALRGKKQVRVHPKDTKDNSQALSELYDNLRAKIFATLSKLGFENLGGHLSVEELVRYKKIQKYLDFKVGEVWEEVETELDYEGVRPTSPDLECLQMAKQMTLKKANNVLTKQLEISRKKQEKEKEEERHFYAEFIDSHSFPVYQRQKEKPIPSSRTHKRIY